VAGDGFLGIGHTGPQAGEVWAKDDVWGGRVGLERDTVTNEGDELLIGVGSKRGGKEGGVQQRLGRLVEVKRGDDFAVVVVAEVPDGTLTAGVEFGVKDDKRGVGGAAGV
jgi:hypothetical protein